MRFMNKRALFFGAMLPVFLTLTAYSDEVVQNYEQPHTEIAGGIDTEDSVSPISRFAAKLEVVNEDGTPLAGAKILIGYEVNDPFPNNELITDRAGSITLPNQWKSALPVTVIAAGQVRTTFAAVLPTQGKISVSKAEGTEKLEIKGSTLNFGPLTQDGQVDFGLVIPAFKIQDLFHFDLSAVISPETDQIRVAGQKIDLPSNLTLPKQTESYIIPIVLEKPKYRIYVREPGVHSFFALHGRFPLKDVVGDIRDGKSIFEVINYFDFLEGGLTPLNVDKSGAKADLQVDKFRFNKELTVIAPQFRSDKSLLALAMAEVDGLLVPTDVKRLLPNQSLKLKTSSMATSTRVLHVLTNSQNLQGERPEAVAGLDLDDNSHSQESGKPTQPHDKPALRILADASLAPSTMFNQLTFVLQDSKISGAPQFLEMIGPPHIEPNLIRLQTPRILPDVSPVATYLVLSDVEYFTSGSVKSEKRTRIWEVFSNDWVSQVRLPNFTLNRLPNHKYRWEVMYFARGAGPGAKNDKGNVLDGVTHVTRNAVDF
jgi:hypothetical protein